MKPKIEKLKEEINKLKAKKEAQLELTKNFQEKNKLIKEINLLKRAGRKPSIFGRNLFKGTKTVGKTLGRGLTMTWKGIQKASQNLESRNKELKEVSKKIKKQDYKKPINSLERLYLGDLVPKNITPKKRGNPWELP